MKPTLYYLFFKANKQGEYDVYEAHTCQEKGCLMTSDQYITTCLPGKVEEFVENYDKNLIEGKVDGYEVEDYLGDGH